MTTNLTSHHQNLISSLLGAKGHLCHIWRNTLKVFLRKRVHRTGMDRRWWRSPKQRRRNRDPQERHCVGIFPWGFGKTFCAPLWLFCDTKKNQDHFLLHRVTALQVSFCLPVNADTSQDITLHLKLLRLSDSRRDCDTVTGEDSRTPARLFKQVWCKAWIWNWLHTLMREDGLPQHWGWHTMLRSAVRLQQLVQGRKLSPYDPASSRLECSVRWKQQGRIVKISILNYLDRP